MGPTGFHGRRLEWPRTGRELRLAVAQLPPPQPLSEPKTIHEYVQNDLQGTEDRITTQIMGMNPFHAMIALSRCLGAVTAALADGDDYALLDATETAHRLLVASIESVHDQLRDLRTANAFKHAGGHS